MTQASETFWFEASRRSKIQWIEYLWIWTKKAIRGRHVQKWFQFFMMIYGPKDSFTYQENSVPIKSP